MVYSTGAFNVRASGSAIAAASPGAAWQQITAIGGNNRYYYMNFLWGIREFMDWCVGGPGLVVPVHLFIFKGMTAAIARRAAG